jgi:hypothetical protein
MKALPRVVVALGAILVACGARGQTEKVPWRFSASVAYYDVPHAQDFWNPIFTADHGRLHLEARHNYVSIDTSSLWAGINFRSGETWNFGATLLFGYVVGSVEGIGTGYELSLHRAWFALASQGEFIYDWQNELGDSLYSWTEVTGAPADWCRLGLVLQTTHDYGMSDDIQPGAAAAFAYKGYAWEVDVLDPFRDDTTFILTFTWSF